MSSIYKRMVMLYGFIAICQVSAQESQAGVFFTVERLKVIEEYLQQGMFEAKVPGVAIALIENGKMVYQKGYGVADSVGNPVTPQTPFQLASVTKSFTALLTLQLEQDRKLLLTEPVVNHIPWFRTADKSLSDQITIRHLLQHNSGLTTRSGNWTQNTTYRGGDATELSVKKLLHTELHSIPGSTYEYSNSNYHLLSHLIEVVEGKPFEEVMFERVLAPLKMNNSFIQLTQHNTVRPAIGFPHWFGYPLERPFILGRMKMGDGGMVASAEDMGRYIIEVAGGEQGVVSGAMRGNLLNSDLNSNAAYALGWQVSSSDGHPLYEHAGTNGGFNSWVGFSDANDQRDGIGFVILSNTSSALYDRFVLNLRQVILTNEAMPMNLNKLNLIFLITCYSAILVFLFFLYRIFKKPPADTLNIKGFIVPAFLLVYSYIMAYTVPAMFKINLLSIYPFFPDLAVGLFGCALLSAFLALLMLWKRVLILKA